MLQTFLTGLREGLEAALVVSILMTFLVRGGHRDRIPALWAGVGVAVVLSFGFGALLHFTSANMSFEAQEAFGGTLSIVAVGFVTWMVFWMRRASHTIKADLHGKMQAAVDLGATAVGLAALLAVGREGLETALFIYPTFQAQGAGWGPALGAVLGLATAIAIGVGIYQGAVHMDLARFFKFTGAALIVIASGVLAYGVHDLQEAGILPGLGNLAWDIEGWDVTSWYGTIVKGVFNVGPQMTVLEVIVYFAYLIPTMYLFLRPVRRAPAAPTDAGGAGSTTAGAPSTPLVRRAGLVVLVGVLPFGALACSSDESDLTVAVTGTDDACELADTSLPAGKVAFEFTNEADDISELYVLRPNGDVVSEVENVTTGTSRTLTVDLTAGDYEVRCKPGQTGDGFATAFEVTGEGGTAAATPDREVAFDAVEYTYPGLEVDDIVADETIRFEMTNEGTQRHEFEVLGPDGDAVGEVAATDPGADGGATIVFDEPGEYTYQCILEDPETGQPHSELGMVGTFEVGAS